MHLATFSCVSTGFSGVQHLGFSSSIPKADLLFYSKLPNTEDTTLGDDEVIADENYAFGGWILPSGNTPVYTATGTDWYVDVSTPKVLQDSDILALPSINSTNVFFSFKRGLAVYNSSLSSDTLTKVKKYYRIS